MSQFDPLISEAKTALAAVGSIADLEQVKARFLGKSGVLTEQLKQLGKLSAEERPAAGAAINLAKQAVEELVSAQREAILAAEQAYKLNAETIDATLPGRGKGQGGLHQVSRTMARIEQLFHSIGFEVAEGPE